MSVTLSTYKIFSTLLYYASFWVLVMKAVIEMLVKKDIQFLVSSGRAVTLSVTVIFMHSFFPGTVGEAANKSIMPSCRL